MNDLLYGLMDRICRGRRLDTKEWVYGYCAYRNNKSYIVRCDDTETISLSSSEALIKVIQVNGFTLSPSTMFDDIDHNMIFCGDIIETVPSDESLFGERNPMLVLCDEGIFYAKGFIEVDTEEFKYCRIIGNIYENPELLDLLPDIEADINVDGNNHIAKADHEE